VTYLASLAGVLLRAEGAFPSAETVFTGHRGKNLYMGEDTHWFSSNAFLCRGREDTQHRSPFTAYQTLHCPTPADLLNKLYSLCFGMEGHISLASLL